MNLPDANKVGDRLKSDATDWQSRVPTSLLKPSMVGLLVIVVFGAGFGVWAFTAPLAGAAIAPGIVVASGQNQKVGHLEGGIISEIAVQEGQAIVQGQALVLLDETQAKSSRNRVNQSIVSLTAVIERATAELVDETEIKFSSELIAEAAKTNNGQLLELQRAEFRSRLKQHKSEVSILDEQISAIEEEILGLEHQAAAESRKLNVLSEEIEAKKSLLDRGLTPRNQYNALIRTQADTQGAIGRINATIGQRRIAISEVRERQVALRAARQAQASTLINDTRPQITDLQEQLASRADVLNRMVIRSPIDGVIVDISKNTIGSVLAPGETILEILPTSNDLVIAARIAPHDVDSVRVGQTASVRFTALNSRTTPEVPATVEYLSADRLMDQVTNEPYFDARLRLASNFPTAFEPEQIHPGMPVDAFIKTRDRTFMDYLLKPLTDSFGRAFKEE